MSRSLYLLMLAPVVHLETETPPNPRNVPIPDSRPASVISRPASRAIQLDDPGATSPTDALGGVDGKEGKRTWGFLKKMSMGRMRSTSSPRDHHHFAVPSTVPGVPPVPGVGAGGRHGGMVRAHTTAGRTTSPLPQLSPMPSPSPSLGANGHAYGHHGLGRPDGLMHTASAPAVPRIGEDGILLPPAHIGAFASQTSLPTITAPVMEEEEDEQHEFEQRDEGAPPLPAKSPLQHKLSREALSAISTSLQLPGGQGPSRTPSPNPSAQLLTPLSTRAQRRRSFLPLASASSSSSGYFEIPVPSPGPFLRDPVPTPSDAGGDRSDEVVVPESSHSTSQPQYIVAPPTSDTSAHHHLDEDRETEARARADAYKRGLRTVMAYLQDLSDLSGALGASVASNGADGSTTPGSPSASASTSTEQAKRRRPTVNGGGSSTVERVFSDGGSSQHGSMSTGSPGLHKKASMISLAGPAMSVSTTESSGSAGVEERKYKEDKNKRTYIIKEIVR